MINDVFDLMDKWRHFPNWQLERRTDIFFGLYLKEILAIKQIKNIEGIIPEFPIRQGELKTLDDFKDLKDTNRSYKIDYLVFFKDPKASNHAKLKAVIVELKTDMASRTPKQDKYLEGAKKMGVLQLLAGLLKIYEATKATDKYSVLLNKLVKMRVLEKVDTVKDKNQVEYKIQDQDKYEAPQIIYIQPNKDKNKNVITFPEIAKKIENGDEIQKRFSQSLKKWSEVKAGNKEDKK